MLFPIYCIALDGDARRSFFATIISLGFVGFMHCVLAWNLNQSMPYVIVPIMVFLPGLSNIK